MKLPLPKTIRLSKVVPKIREFCVNLFFLNGMLISRPGVVQLEAAPANCRAVFEFSGYIYAVYGNEVYLYGPPLTLIGTILGSGPIVVANGFNHAAICVPGLANYILTAPSTLAFISDPDLPVCRDVDRVNGYYVWIPFDGSPALYSDVGDASSIEPLSFFDAEMLPDKNAGVANFKNDLFIFGEESTERFRQIGPATAPFVRVEGGNIAVGYLGGKIISQENLFFVGRNQGQGPGIFSMVISVDVARISTPAIDEILEFDYTEDELKDCVPGRFQWRGADIYTFSFKRHTFCFVNGNWSFFSSDATQQAVDPWDYTSFEYLDGKYYTGKSGSFGQLSDSDTDEGTAFQRIITTFARSEEKTTFSINYIDLEVAYGALDTGSVAISLTRDAVTWGNRFFVDYDNTGQFQGEIEFRYPGGLGLFDGFAGIEFFTESDASFAVDNAVIGI